MLRWVVCHRQSRPSLRDRASVSASKLSEGTRSVTLPNIPSCQRRFPPCGHGDKIGFDCVRFRNNRLGRCTRNNANARGHPDSGYFFGLGLQVLLRLRHRIAEHISNRSNGLGDRSPAPCGRFRDATYAWSPAVFRSLPDRITESKIT